MLMAESVLGRISSKVIMAYGATGHRYQERLLVKITPFNTIARSIMIPKLSDRDTAEDRCNAVHHTVDNKPNDDPSQNLSRFFSREYPIVKH
jgi:hypothetical protein